MHEKRNIFHAINTNSSQMQAIFYGGLFNALDDEHDNAINAINASVPPAVMAQAAPLLSVPLLSVPLLSVDHWKHTKAFINNERRETQTQYYVRMNAAPAVVELVSLDSKPFGSVSELILAELFQMTPRTSSQHDGIFQGHKCEIKCARHWAGKNDCRWQHMEPEHDYTFAMLALLEFHEWKVWCVTKAQLMGELREKKVVTFQGKQGWWTLKSAIMPYLTPIHGLECLRKFVSALPK